MTPIITAPHSNPDRRWSVTGDAGARPNALNADSLKLPAALSTAAIISSSMLEPHLDPSAAPATNPVFQSFAAEQSHFPHRRTRHPA